MSASLNRRARQRSGIRGAAADAQLLRQIAGGIGIAKLAAEIVVHRLAALPGEDIFQRLCAAGGGAVDLGWVPSSPAP